MPVTDHEGLNGCEMLTIPYFVNNGLTEDEVVSPTRRPHFTPHKPL
jgi:hypothetical protein